MFSQLDQTLAELTGANLAAEIVSRLPACIEPEKRAELEKEFTGLIDEKLCNLKIAKKDLENEITQKIETLARTTNDLEKIPFFGPLGLFLRGMQRPIWGLALLFIDLKVFSGAWSMPPASQTESAFWLLNLLILGFLFGERAVRNVMPMVNRRMGKLP